MSKNQNSKGEGRRYSGCLYTDYESGAELYVYPCGGLGQTRPNWS